MEFVIIKWERFVHNETMAVKKELRNSERQLP